MTTEECLNYLFSNYGDTLKKADTVTVKEEYMYLNEQINIFRYISIIFEKNRWITTSSYFETFEECLAEIEKQLKNIKVKINEEHSIID